MLAYKYNNTDELILQLILSTESTKQTVNTNIDKKKLIYYKLAHKMLLFTLKENNEKTNSIKNCHTKNLAVLKQYCFFTKDSTTHPLFV